MGEESFAHVLDTNLTGTYRLVKAVAGPMLRNRWGRIVFISSVVAMSGSAGQANYAASKAGLIGLARSLAREFGPRGVTCNVIAPGFIETDMTADLGDERRDEVRDSIPLNRMGSAEDVAATVEFLTSDAGGYITGAVIPVDGGLGMGH
jgi:3-oxoacyl-[acyl-carrier protein] reductase